MNSSEKNPPTDIPSQAPMEAPTATATGTPLVLGSRGSELALAQARWVAERLEESSGRKVEIRVIKTTGDADQKTRLNAFPGMGVFVKELQTALLSGEIHCALHSLKDVPEEQPEGLTLAAFPGREDARDVFLSNGTRFRDLPKGAKVGTGSPRRIMQLHALRSDLEYVGIRGNIETRLRQVTEGKLDGIVLAAAGLRRLGLQAKITHSFSFDEMIPAIGQGALALECRKDDDLTLKALDTVDDDPVRAMVELERRFMGLVGGGCKVPMAAHAYPFGDGVRMMAVMGDLKTHKMTRVEQGADLDDAEDLVEELTERILEECRDLGIPIPKDLPEHHLLGGDSL